MFCVCPQKDTFSETLEKYVFLPKDFPRYYLVRSNMSKRANVFDVATGKWWTIRDRTRNNLDVEYKTESAV